MSSKLQTVKLQTVRGTHDILPEEMRLRHHIYEAARQVATLYGFHEMATPVFEFTDVFHRTLGDSSDVVTKETYTFEDRGGESLTLRPEFTAACVRAFLSNGLTQSLPVKWLYHGPAFRYERPQKGRMRQFHQIGAEYIGEANPVADVEVIACAHSIINRLGLKDNAVLEINSLGDSESRNAYRQALIAYLTARKSELSEESVARLERNPLRVLDSKDAGDKAVVADAPVLADYFTTDAKQFFAQVLTGLEALAIPYTLNSTLVRGLDYYSHTVFEFTTTALGAQGTLLAGGRYDGLVEQMGGPSVPGLGWAMGIERLVALLESDVHLTADVPVAVIPLQETLYVQAAVFAHQLRNANIGAEVILKHNAGKAFKHADKMGCTMAVILAEQENAAGQVVLKNLTTGEQTAHTPDEAIAMLRK